jgi:hypothetical protein
LSSFAVASAAISGFRFFPCNEDGVPFVDGFLMVGFLTVLADLLSPSVSE